MRIVILTVDLGVASLAISKIALDEVEVVNVQMGPEGSNRWRINAIRRGYRVPETIIMKLVRICCGVHECLAVKQMSVAGRAGRNVMAVVGEIEHEAMAGCG